MWVELGVVAGIGAAAFVAWPLWRSRNHQDSRVMALRLGELETQRDLAYRELVDLDDDRNLGKISEEDYAPLLAESRQRAAMLLREIDHVRPLAETEMSLAKAEVASLEGAESSRGSRICPNCDFSADPSANFCSNCGVRLHEDGQPNPERPLGNDETP